MLVRVVGVGYVRVRVPRRLVMVLVAMRAYGHRVVRVRMMPVVVRVGVLVFEFIVIVLMSVRLHQVKCDTRKHQRAA